MCMGVLVCTDVRTRVCMHTAHVCTCGGTRGCEPSAHVCVSGEEAWLLQSSSTLDCSCCSNAGERWAALQTCDTDHLIRLLCGCLSGRPVGITRPTETELLCLTPLPLATAFCCVAFSERSLWGGLPRGPEDGPLGSLTGTLSPLR